GVDALQANGGGGQPPKAGAPERHRHEQAAQSKHRVERGSGRQAARPQPGAVGKQKGQQADREKDRQREQQDPEDLAASRAFTAGARRMQGASAHTYISYISLPGLSSLNQVGLDRS